MKKNIILIGPQGCGKGTQGKILAEKFGFKIFETGAQLRKISAENSPLGTRVREIIERGDLVPNEIVMEIVENFLQKIDKNSPVIFDGIPRSELQRDSLENLLQKNGRDFLALEIKLSPEKSIARLLRRAEIEHRADDNLAAIKNRLQNFAKFTAPLLEKWRQNKKLFSVDGENSIEKIHEKIVEILQISKI